MKTLQLTNREINYLIKATNTRWAKVDKRLRILDSMTEQEIADHDAELEGLEFFKHGEEVAFHSKERRELEQLETYLQDKLEEDVYFFGVPA